MDCRQKIFSRRISLSNSVFTQTIPLFSKKYFGGNEKGCIFASAFAQKTGVEKKRQLFETDERKEIACVTYLIIDRVGDTKTSQEGKREQFLQ